MGWLDLLLGIAVGVGTVVLVRSYITKQEIRKQATIRFKEVIGNAKHVNKGLKEPCARINNLSQKSVGVGLYNFGEELGSLKIEARDGVDPDLRVGQVIPLEV